jgi:hypothetical protein
VLSWRQRRLRRRIRKRRIRHTAPPGYGWVLFTQALYVTAFIIGLVILICWALWGRD